MQHNHSEEKNSNENHATSGINSKTIEYSSWWMISRDLCRLVTCTYGCEIARSRHCRLRMLWVVLGELFARKEVSLFASLRPGSLPYRKPDSARTLFAIISTRSLCGWYIFDNLPNNLLILTLSGFDCQTPFIHLMHIASGLHITQNILLQLRHRL